MGKQHIAKRVVSKLEQWRRAAELRSIAHKVDVDPTKALLIFAQPRGGSTWLEELVRTIPRTATIWEPLDIQNNPTFKEIGFWWRQYIPEDARWPEAEELFQRLFSGKMLSNYLTRTTDPQELVAAERLIVKFVRGNLLLPWVVRRFDLPKPVLLIRHPCAVVSSQMRSDAWDHLPHSIRPTPHPHQELVDSYRPMLDTISTFEERQAASWCIDHKMILEHPRNDIDWTTITYEELMTRPEPTLKKVFDAWGMELPQGILDQLREPSNTAEKGAKVQDTQAQLGIWKKRLQPEQIDRILAMVDRFGITLYDGSLMPRTLYTP